MKRVGIITMHCVINYGSVLQAYATQEIIKTMGFDSQIINYKFPNIFQFQHGTTYYPFTWRNWLGKTFGLNSMWRRVKAFEKFRNLYLNQTGLYASQEELSKDVPVFDVYLTGSDQVWNVNHSKGDLTFLLDFAPINSCRISYASSFSISKLPDQFCPEFARLLRNYNYISVRENTGVDIVKSLTGKIPIVVLDPTLLLNAKQWNMLADKMKDKYCGEKYILVYLLDYAFNPRPTIYELVKKIKKDTGYRVIFLGKMETSCGITDGSLAECDSPIEFLHLIRNAAVVITSSFHGVAFAINYERPLLALIENAITDNRIPTLLGSIGLDNLIVQVNSNIDDCSPYYNISAMQVELQKQRTHSIGFLRDALFSL